MNIDQREVQIDRLNELKKQSKMLSDQIHSYKTKNRALQPFTIEREFKNTTKSKINHDRIKLDSATKELEYTHEKLQKIESQQVIHEQKLK